MELFFLSHIIKGIIKYVFFLNHKVMESQESDTNNKVNAKEDPYLLWNFVFIFFNKDIRTTILQFSMYKGQMTTSLLYE
jgi:hypothetical protein